jgi:hypothetical protein
MKAIPMKVFVLSACAVLELDGTLWVPAKGVPGSLVGYESWYVHPIAVVPNEKRHSGARKGWP